jgi:hypothetical protein
MSSNPMPKRKTDLLINHRWCSPLLGGKPFVLGWEAGNCLAGRMFSKAKGVV